MSKQITNEVAEKLCENFTPLHYGNHDTHHNYIGIPVMCYRITGVLCN